MDIGASQHMTKDQEWFTTCQPTSGRVLLGNDHRFKVAGIVLAP